MERFVIDTNFFFNLQIDSGLGNNPKTIIINLTDLIKKLKEKKLADFFMPPRIVDEFLTFFKEEKEKDFVENFLTFITIKSPAVENHCVNTRILYQLIEEVRQRFYRGLNIAEDAARNAAQKLMGKTIKNKIEFEKAVGEVIRNLRERYRQATRFQFIDSIADLDLIFLAKEIEGFLVSSDEGVLRWGRIIGVKELPAHLIRQRLLFLLAGK